MRELSNQEAFWKGDFGNQYVERNTGDELVASSTAFFASVLHSACKVGSVLELGANIGLNMVALHTLLPGAELHAVEINDLAAEQCAKLGFVHVTNSSIYDYEITRMFDLTFCNGVLIHQNPELLPKAYEKLYQASKRYILVSEYYNPVPVAVSYRGHEDVLFKRDFAGEMMDMYPDLKLVDYGFVYHRDHNFARDDATWFLMEKDCRANRD